MKRRSVLKHGLALTAAATLPRMTLAMASPPDDVDYILTAEAGSAELVDGQPSDILGFNGQFPAPVIRVRQGDRLRLRFDNRLDQASTIHWHGIRIDNAMDGVPMLSQKPVEPGESFVYDFVCPDAGTFWYHPHIHSIRQLGMGMVGVLIVEEPEPQPYHEVIIGLKDWRLTPDGSYLPLSIPREAFRDGTLGTVNTVNGQQRPTIEVPAGAALRLRILNMDNTRVFRPEVSGQASRILALDGSPVIPHRPFELTPLGAGMRMDLAMHAPPQPGVEIPVYDQKGRFGVELCRLRTVESQASHPPAELPALPPNPIPVPDLATAETLRFVFEWQGALSPTRADGEVDHSFWLINRRAWSGGEGHHSLPAPLATLKLGQSYIAELHNATPHQHPIHLHGLIFTVLSSDKRSINPYQSDTILLEKNERARIAFVADNPGNWMFHCHVIEHMKTGLMGYIAIL